MASLKNLTALLLLVCFITGTLSAEVKHREKRGWWPWTWFGWGGDNTDPVISDCPSDQTAITDSESPTATVSWTEPTATDNRGDQTLTSDYSPGDVFDIGTTEVTYTSTDPAGNSATCTFNVIVIDDEDPVISDCPGAQSELSSGLVSWSSPSASDNSGQYTLISDYNIGDLFPFGTTTVTYTASDPSGNSATCTFDVEITGDSDPPVISGCPGNMEIGTDYYYDYGTASWTEPTATDNSGVETINSDHAPGDAFGVGTTTVTYTAVDDVGNSDTCTFDVIVFDGDGPMLSDCPGTQYVCGAGPACWAEPTVRDNVDPNPTVSSSDNSGDTFSQTTPVTYTATDASGNTDTCGFDVVVMTSPVRK